ncbi:MAG TPA: 50S ribosomal protein L5 [Candidatus Paceibacterota bacterium]|nr:50S ribosomal protein L5 [Candidatus Paceibacterota bacterium]
MTDLATIYKTKAVPALRKEFSITNAMAVPRILKVTVNTGVGRTHKDSALMEKVERDLGLLTGQKAAAREAKKSIASFKLRQGSVVGYMATLRGRRMWDFMERFIALALPVSKDFRGLETKSVDRQGNLNLGVREHSIFPEINLENIKDIFGLQVTVTTTAGDHERGLALFRHLGFPFKKA